MVTKEELESLLQKQKFNEVDPELERNIQILSKQWSEIVKQDPLQALLVPGIVDQGKSRTLDYYEGFTRGAGLVEFFRRVDDLEVPRPYTSFSACYKYVAHRIHELKNQS